MSIRKSNYFKMGEYKIYNDKGHYLIYKGINFICSCDPSELLETLKELSGEG